MDQTIQRLKQLKKQSGLTLKQISDRSGISLGTVYKIFSGGINSVKTNTYEKLVECLQGGTDKVTDDNQSDLPLKPDGVTVVFVSSAI